MSSPRKPVETRPSGLAPLAVLPVFIKLEGRRAVIAGGGPGAAWKAKLLAAAGPTNTHPTRSALRKAAPR